MKEPVDHYPKALVPEYLTKQTIEKIPFETPYFVMAGERDDYGDLVIFVTDDRRLHMSKSFPLEVREKKPSNPVGLVGVMRVPLITAETGEVSERFVADLRFIGDYQLVDTESIIGSFQDQEEYMALLATIEDSVTFGAFIAPEHGSNAASDVPEGTFYGDSRLYSHLEQLQARGDKALKVFLKRKNKEHIDAIKVKKKEKVKKD